MAREMTLSKEDKAIIDDTVRESYKLNKRRAGKEIAKYLAAELRKQLVRQYLDDKDK